MEKTLVCREIIGTRLSVNVDQAALLSRLGYGLREPRTKFRALCLDHLRCPADDPNGSHISEPESRPCVSRRLYVVRIVAASGGVRSMIKCSK